MARISQDFIEQVRERNDIVEGNNLRLLFEYQKSDASKDFELSLFEESVYNFLNENNFTVKKQ